MIVNLLTKKDCNSNIKETTVKEIFDDCIVCGTRRNKANLVDAFLGEKLEKINIIQCLCSRSLNHQDLTIESELIFILKEKGIVIDDHRRRVS